MPPGRVLVARRLLPSDTVALPRCTVVGIVVECAGPGSHAALLAEALGIPTVAQIPNVTERVAEGDLLVVDGLRGEMVINPDGAMQARYEEEIRGAQARSARIRQSAREPARTLDGSTVAVLANVGCREDVVAAADQGADGVGLCRLEQFYLSRTTPPSVAELLAELRVMFAPVKGKPITVRLLDLGGDKPLPFLKLPEEDNPFLGRRGVRFLLRYPELLDTQLRVLFQYSQEQNVRILVPMVTLAADMVRVQSRLAVITNHQGQGKLPPLGAMIETPAAALTVSEIKAHADFLSVGTNDLTQYTLAAGRENQMVSEYYIEDHPSVLRLVRIITEEAGGLPVSVCGELARQLNIIPTLLKQGIRILSVAPPLVPGVKEAVRQTVLSQPVEALDFS
jgi:phosphotransferase system enzyme I (PtsI)